MKNVHRDATGRFHLFADNIPVAKMRRLTPDEKARVMLHEISTMYPDLPVRNSKISTSLYRTKSNSKE